MSRRHARGPLRRPAGPIRGLYPHDSLGCLDVHTDTPCEQVFRMIEDTVLLDVKQRPYVGIAEKEKCW
jgi:hypothetical protein